MARRWRTTKRVSSVSGVTSSGNTFLWASSITEILHFAELSLHQVGDDCPKGLRES